MNKPALFCGVIRNGGEALSRTLERLDQIRGHFEMSKLVIVTNDNTDDTDEVLTTWTNQNPQGNRLIRADGLLEAYPDRVDRICVARNFYLREVQTELLATNWDCVIVADLDGPNETLDPNWFANLNRFDFEWDGLFANQLPSYYDIYALRHPEWCPDDCWLRVDRGIPWGAKLVPPLRRALHRRLVNRYVYDRQFHIPTDTAPIPVLSAFGGLGIYRAKALRGCYYGSRLRNGDVVCEHVTLHDQIRKRGGKLFIMPDLVNLAEAGHVSSGPARQYPGY